MNRARLFFILGIACLGSVQARSWRDRLLGQQGQPAMQSAPVQYRDSSAPVSWQPNPMQESYRRQSEYAQQPAERAHQPKEDSYRQSDRVAGSADEEEPEDVKAEDERFAGLSDMQVEQATSTDDRVSSTEPNFHRFLDEYDRSNGIGKMVLLCLLKSNEKFGVKLRFKLKVMRGKARRRWYYDRWVGLTDDAETNRDGSLVEAAQLRRIIRLVVDAASALSRAEEDGYTDISKKTKSIKTPTWKFIARCNDKKITNLTADDLDSYDETKISREAHDAIRLLIKSLWKSTSEKLKLDILKSRASVEWFEKHWAQLKHGQLAALCPLITLILLFDEQFKQWHLRNLGHAADTSDDEEEE